VGGPRRPRRRRRRAGRPELANPRLSASLLFTSDDEIHALNREWRQRDKPTNVLSFPMLERDDLLALDENGPPELLGDVALAYETCAREAADKGVPLEHHATHLIVHGLLHLAGYDHDLSTTTPRQWKRSKRRRLRFAG
jgi:probable rRNA maturation factor